MIATIRTARQLRGEVRLPGDKSISHRALILGAIAQGASSLRGLSQGEDVRSTASCLRALGVEVDETTVVGRGMTGLKPAAGALDCGNSGTTMRLLSGLLAAQPFRSELTGDESLRSRPMDRVVEPLTRMGAHATWPPLRVGGGGPLRGIEYRPPVPSAQVKSAVLLAGLFANGVTEVAESVVTRDHTERMLRAMGAPVTPKGSGVRLEKAERLRPLMLAIPGDISAASFWLVAGALVPRSRIRIRDVGLNPTRTGFIELLRRSGFGVTAGATSDAAGEPVGWLEVAGGKNLRPVIIGADDSAAMIDELPALAVAATQLPGVSRIAGARELRVKESNRIDAMAEGLAVMGADIRGLDDGWEIHGPTRLEGARVRSRGDHRIAMALAVAALLARGETTIEDAECAAISYPGFFDEIEELTRGC
ncbi:MAG TPA: 3-phosphoshikimate 1-carboxyvinyltransferase [Candidatus Dormibacteraeota bacterium]|nr:3-phosphoshikimate 1-carboxyvinyltransferase [Candidatus Dormibacteraeota bacterium]